MTHPHHAKTHDDDPAALEARRHGPLYKGAWFVLLWIAGVAVVGAVAYAIRLMILP